MSATRVVGVVCQMVYFWGRLSVIVEEIAENIKGSFDIIILFYFVEMK
jgi:hypothetical protein